MSALFRIAGFIPFVAMIFLNAFVDLGHKIIIQNTVFKVYDGDTQIILTAIVNGLILIPFVLLFAPSGFLADRFCKPRVMVVSALSAVGLTLLITLAYYQGWFQAAFALTFLLAVQSAFYSPAKYGYIKELAGQERLAPMNAVVQMVTIVAILLGVFLFSILFEQALAGYAFQAPPDLLQHVAPVGWVLVACSLLELVVALRLPMLQEENPTLDFKWQRYVSGSYLKENVGVLRDNRSIWLSIVGLSVFWGISQVVLATFPAFAKEVLSESNTVVIQGLLACSGLGIIFGSLLAGKTSRHHIETGLVPLGAIGVVTTLFMITQLDSVLLLALDILAMGVFGGIFIVPLNALIQFHARDEQLGTVLAGNNWVQNITMLGFLVMTVFFAVSGAGSVGLFGLLTTVALIGALYTLYQLPQSLVRYLIGRLFAGYYRVEVLGFDRLPGQGGVLMLGNHISWLDWAMVQIACPRPVRFVMHRDYYRRWYLRWFLDFFGVVPIAPGQSKEALEQVNTLLKAGEVVCLFPEGAISRNGQLGEFKRGFEHVVDGVDGIILPFYLRGLWGSRFSRSGEGLKEAQGGAGRRDIIVAFGDPLPMGATTHEVKQRVFDLSIEAWERYTDRLDPIPLAWIRTVKRQGGNLCVADARGGSELSGYKTLTAAILFSRLIGRRSREQNIGLLLPTSSAGIITNMAVLLLGKRVVNLNYTASLQSLEAAVSKAEIETIYTSRRFIKKLSQRGVLLDSLLAKCNPVYLEDLKDEIAAPGKLAILAMVTLLPASLLYLIFGKRTQVGETAAILFSSGSEGEPKGVMLSHQNIMGNIKQISDVLDTRRDDAVMASLPLFHAFGLTVTGFLPLVEGVPAICHPDPTDVLTIAKAIARNRVTVMCGTSTFLRLYVRNRRIHPLMLESLRVVVAGAERLNPEIRDAFQSKFNKMIYEGYGTTETTPVASVNIPDRLDTREWRVQAGSRDGTVGLPLPGSSFRVVDPVSLDELPAGDDGLILAGGTQVMLGYLKDPEKTAGVIVELDGKRWYKTGDKGHLDNDGFLTIVDRYSRFAKIGGEMISLGAVEHAVAQVMPEGVEVMATSLPDSKKGEQVVLLYAGEIEEQAVKRAISEAQLNPLMIPARLVGVDAIPKLGSGKSDFQQAKQLAQAAA
ncbi:MAG: acyl-[ACP]--phospholipid O-acyltransferase [Gammaproteobacteria bacterium]|nr:acyl-[ACP]--phospholipid O-acyltransferase [Gammaproteobacteria bacterium]